MRFAIVASALLGFLCMGSAAAEEARDDARRSADVAIERFSGRTEVADIDRVAINHFTGRIEIAVEAGDIAIELVDTPNDYPVALAQDDKTIIIAGEKRPKKFDVHDVMNWRLHKEDAFAHFIDAHPRLTLSVPEGTAIELNNVYAIAEIGDLRAALKLKSKYMEAQIGGVESADIVLYGDGAISIGPVRSHLYAKVGGAGDVSAISAGSAEILVGGSGDVTVGAIAGDASFKVSGSGDITADDVAGQVTAFISGSGDIAVGAIASGAEFSIAGSGDIVARSLNGPALARIAGNGDITVSGGRAENLKIGITGAGDFHFGGVSTNLDATINGSGSIEIAENEGLLRTSGRGAFRIGNTSINNND